MKLYLNYKENKKTTFVFLTFLAVACLSLVVSCKNETFSPEEKFACVRFEADSTRKVTADYEPELYGDLYWFYTAEKCDSYGTLGATDDAWGAVVVPGSSDSSLTLSKGLDNSSIGKFSLGKWKFKLSAYKGSGAVADSGQKIVYLASDSETSNTCINTGSYTLVYESEEVEVELVSSEKKTISMEVSAKGNTGELKFGEIYMSNAPGKSTVEIIANATDSSKKKYLFTTNNDTADTDSEESYTGRYTISISQISGKENYYSMKEKNDSSMTMDPGTYKLTVKVGATEVTDMAYCFAIFENTVTTLSNENSGVSSDVLST